MPLMKDQAFKRPSKTSETRDAWLANSDDCLLRPRRGLSHEGCSERHSQRARGTQRAARLANRPRPPEIAAKMLAFMEIHGVKSVMTDCLLGRPHQEGIDHEGEYCPDPHAPSSTAEIGLRGSL
jgi:hypothetical protein